jgi:NADH-quinone oxidoreductase subunit N
MTKMNFLTSIYENPIKYEYGHLTGINSKTTFNLFSFVETNDFGLIEKFSFEIFFSMGIFIFLIYFTFFNTIGKKQKKEKVSEIIMKKNKNNILQDRFIFTENKLKNILCKDEMSSAVTYAVLLLSFLIYVNHLQDTNIPYVLNNFFIIDNLSKYGKDLICFLSILCLLGSKHYLKKNNFTFEYIVILFFAIFGLCLLLSAYDFITIYLAIELQSLAFYVLAASRKDSTYSVEAGLKYFILGSFASALLIFGMSLIYAMTGIIHLSDLSLYVVNLSSSFSSFSDFSIFASNQSIQDLTFMFGLFLILSGLLFKLGAAPFHMWVPEVYEGAPTSVSMFFGVVPKVVIFAILYRICQHVFFDLSEEWFFVIFTSSALSLTFGSLGGLSQRRIKRLLAFSAINHVGYILMGIMACTTFGAVAMAIYVVIYALTSVLIWTILISLETYKTNNKEYSIRYIGDLKGFVEINPMISFILVMTLFSFAGVPPMGGFFAKAYIFLAAVHSKMYFSVFLALVFSLISAFYYLRFVKQVYTFNFDFNNLLKLYLKKQQKLLYLVF